MEHILLLTAPRGAGKTTACWRFVEAAKGEGLQVEGILAPARLDDTGRKVGIDVLDVATGTRRNLAWLEPDESRRTIGPYRFDLEAMAWALDCVLQALDKPG
ncbi:MAG: hypothetical protein H5T69_15590, partial [Chloroflexi bacterium]|nr:hypothetical protein [Chloroflexota bacterium]